MKHYRKNNIIDISPIEYEVISDEFYRLTKTIVLKSDLLHDIIYQCNDSVSIYGKCLIIYKDFIWNGSSGGLDTMDSGRATVVHDSLYYILRKCKENKIESGLSRKTSDYIFYQILLFDNMPKFRALYWYCAVRVFGWLHV